MNNSKANTWLLFPNVGPDGGEPFNFPFTLMHQTLKIAWIRLKIAWICLKERETLAKIAKLARFA